MSEIAIRVENLGKRFQLGGQKSGSFRESISRFFQPNSTSQDTEEFWALRDINFEVKRGEAVGIIGRNGAGKSTLLKILSRITEPTQGRFEIFGRVSSLLEVGTGFHPELSGRENVYLNGTILGMKRREVKAKFDEIVTFSGVEKFIDTPVKHYSSGMQVRLAFAVAAHLEPEILIIDEVLAVGDAEFQKKCLGKMEDVTGEGRTVLFVSHNMGAVQALCDKGVLLQKGCITYEGNTGYTIARYLASKKERLIQLSEREDRKGNQKLRFTGFDFLNEDREIISMAKAGDNLTMRLSFEKNTHVLRNFSLDIGINNHLDNRVLWLSTELLVSQEVLIDERKNGTIEVYLKELPLMPGGYSMTLCSRSNGDILDWISDAATLDVESGQFYATGKLPPKGQSNLLVKYMFKISDEIYA